MPSASPKQPLPDPEALPSPLYRVPRGASLPADAAVPPGAMRFPRGELAALQLAEEKRYFRSLVVGALLLGLAAGLCAYRAFSRLSGAGGAGDPAWSYVVLAVAFAVQAASWAIGLKHVLARRSPGGSRVLGAGRAPSKGMLLFQDSAALAGMLAGSLGLYLGERWSDAALSGAGWGLFGAVFAGLVIILVAEGKKTRAAGPAAAAPVLLRFGEGPRSRRV
ncbi:MAG: hypothetical protein HY900_10690 [Deltaproteobacteria bacterium]|nr:hypothetical protein [Deltaproteobacteria bacterium]